MSIRVHFSEITDWQLADHQDYRSKPRDTWKEAGKVRQHGPAPLPAYVEKSRTQAKRSHYSYVLAHRQKWLFKFQRDNVTHSQTGFTSEHDAARAYNAYIRARGWDKTGERRELVIAEDQSA